jgi:hypothetical protein
MLWRHDQPASSSLSQDLAPGVSLLTIDIIWLTMIWCHSLYILGIFPKKGPKATFISVAYNYHFTSLSFISGI